MKLTELINKPIKEVLNSLDVSKLTPVTNDKGEVVKIIVEYIPKKED